MKKPEQWVIPAVLGFLLLPVFTGRTVETGGVDTWHFSTPADAPLYFESDSSPAAGSGRYIARGRQCNILITPSEAVLVLRKRSESPAASPLERIAQSEAGAAESRLVRFRLAGANPLAMSTGLEPLSGRANYFLGNDPADWRTGVPLFGRVQIEGVYPGISLVYYANPSGLEYDFVVQPGAAPGQIALRIEGADRVRVDAAGNLALNIGEDEIRQHRPVVYQMAHGVRKEVGGGYRLAGPATAGFWVGDYDHSLPLVIDPTLAFSTYLGGKLNDKGWGIAVDGNGNVYVAGETLSTDLRSQVTVPGLQTNYQRGTSLYGDAFVAKFTGGTNLAYLTYLGGKGQDAAFAVAADAAGDAFITGFTDSPNFPFWPANAFRTSPDGINGRNNSGQHRYPIDAFVTKLDPVGELAYSVFLGGNKRDAGTGIAVDNLGAAYVTGYTESTNFPTTNALQGPYVELSSAFLTDYYGTNYQGHGDAFVTKISPDATALEYSTYLGGTNQDSGESIAVDSSGCAYVVGWTYSTNFPVANPLLAYPAFLNGETSFSFFSDAFVSKLSADGRSLVYSTFLGGSWNDAALHVALDSSNCAYVTGYTSSTNFPVTLAHFTAYVSRTNVNADVFVTKLDENGSTNGGYSVVFGGRSADQGTGIAVDALGDAYVVGVTSSTTNFAGVGSPVMINFFATNTLGGFTATNTSFRKLGTNDVFIAELDPAGAGFLFSAYLGGSGNDQANGIALDPATGAAYLVGTTTSTNFPGTSPSAFHGGKKKSDAFMGRILFP